MRGLCFCGVGIEEAPCPGPLSSIMAPWNKLLPIHPVTFATSPPSCIQVTKVNKAERAFSAVFGIFLLGVGAYAVLFSEAPLHWAVPAGIVMALVGGNLVYSSYSCKPSWLSRIGPLP